MERVGLKIFKQFAYEFCSVPRINDNTVKNWFNSSGFAVKYSKTVKYDFFDFVNFAKLDDPEDINYFSLNLNKLFDYLGDQEFQDKIIKKMGVKK